MTDLSVWAKSMGDLDKKQTPSGLIQAMWRSFNGHLLTLGYFAKRDDAEALRNIYCQTGGLLSKIPPGAPSVPAPPAPRPSSVPAPRAPRDQLFLFFL